MSKDKLSLKQKIFCEEYAANGGNGTAAAEKAGYKLPMQQATENLRKPNIANYIESLTKPGHNKRIANAEERQEFWSSVLRGDPVDNGEPSKMSDRVRASELLGKSQLDFIEKKIVNINGKVDSNWTVKFVGTDGNEIIKNARTDSK